MAKKSFLESFLNTAVKSADRAIKAAAKERERQRKAEQAKNLYEQLKKQTNLKFESENRTRILNDSIKLIEGSGNIQTIISRKNIAMEHLDWFIRNEVNGVRLTPSASYSKKQLLLIFNDNLYKQIETRILKQLDKVNDLKSIQAKQNAINKALGVIYNNSIYFERTASNYSQVDFKLGKLKEKLKPIGN
ncbi:MAG: hypothetical protein PHI28_03640 [Mangrovibacterium sp.]|nr:hypothetical protein [Mangrovibacterium sp.]